MSEYIYASSGEPLAHIDGEITLARKEIVRCRDCKHLNIVGKCPCGFWALENLNGFCAWGERETINKTDDIVTHDAHADDYKKAAEYWQRMYEETFAERTCRDTGENEWHFVCSACGYEQNGYECWNYCPNCGAKVMDE